MKKYLIICGLIAIVSCSKKEVNPNLDSNVMLEEPASATANPAEGKDEGLALIEGGKGNWGEIPMTPHAGMSQENAKKMVAYILTLKK